MRTCIETLEQPRLKFLSLHKELKIGRVQHGLVGTTLYMIITTLLLIYDEVTLKYSACIPNLMENFTSQCTVMLEPLMLSNKLILHFELSWLKLTVGLDGISFTSHMTKQDGIKTGLLITETTILELDEFQTQIQCLHFMSMRIMIIKTYPIFKCLRRFEA